MAATSSSPADRHHIEIDFTALFSPSEADKQKSLAPSSQELGNPIQWFEHFDSFSKHEKETEIRRGYELFSNLASPVTFDILRKAMEENGIANSVQQDAIIGTFLQSQDQKNPRGGLTALPSVCGDFLLELFREHVPGVEGLVTTAQDAYEFTRDAGNAQKVTWTKKAACSLAFKGGDPVSIGEVSVGVTFDLDLLPQVEGGPVPPDSVKISSACMKLDRGHPAVQALESSLSRSPTTGIIHLPAGALTLSAALERSSFTGYGPVVITPCLDSSRAIQSRGLDALGRACVVCDVSGEKGCTHLCQALSETKKVHKKGCILSIPEDIDLAKLVELIGLLDEALIIAPGIHLGVKVSQNSALCSQLLSLACNSEIGGYLVLTASTQGLTKEVIKMVKATDQQVSILRNETNPKVIVECGLDSIVVVYEQLKANGLNERVLIRPTDQAAAIKLIALDGPGLSAWQLLGILESLPPENNGKDTVVSKIFNSPFFGTPLISKFLEEPVLLHAGLVQKLGELALADQLRLNTLGKRERSSLLDALERNTKLMEKLGKNFEERALRLRPQQPAQKPTREGTVWPSHPRY